MVTMTPESLRRDLFDAIEKHWFLRAIEEIDRTNTAYVYRLHTIRAGLFVQVFLGVRSHTLSFSLVESDRRIYGVDFYRGQWHMHPFEDVGKHVRLPAGLGPTPLAAFLARVEQLCVEYDLL